jgi:hypothetical protein
MKYFVVSTSRANPDKALQELVTEVNQMIETGWKPLGGITFSQWGLLDNRYNQAMVYQPRETDSVHAQE